MRREIGIGILAAAALTATAAGQTYNVTNTLDDGSAGSLRWAINQANGWTGAATINIQSGLGTIGITGPMPLLNNAAGITVIGNNNTISGNDLYRPFFVQSGVLSLQDLTITNARAQGGTGGGGGLGAGAAVFVYSGGLSVNNVLFTNNSANGGNGGTVPVYRP